MSIRTLLLITALIGVPAVYADESATGEHTIIQDLKARIDQADAQEFKALADRIIRQEGMNPYYGHYIGPWVTQQDVTDWTNNLLSYAQEKRNTLRQQCAGLSDNSKEYKTLAKGIGQSHLGLNCALGAMAATVIYAHEVIRRKFPSIYPKCMPFFQRLMPLLNRAADSLVTLPAAVILHPIQDYRAFVGKELKVTASWLVPTLLACLGTKYFMKWGAQNIKQGWNYKKHLENQIKNLDEIITYIQTCPFTPKIEEQI